MMRNRERLLPTSPRNNVAPPSGGGVPWKRRIITNTQMIPTVKRSRTSPSANGRGGGEDDREMDNSERYAEEYEDNGYYHHRDHQPEILSKYIDVKEFDPDEVDVESWLMDFEHAIDADERARHVTWDAVRMYRVLVRKLTGTAEQWYYGQIIRDLRREDRTYPVFKRYLSERFKRTESVDDVICRLMARAKRSDETYSQYAHELRHMARGTPVKESIFVAAFVAGVDRPARNWLSDTKQKTLEEAVVHARDFARSDGAGISSDERAENGSGSGGGLSFSMTDQQREVSGSGSGGGGTADDRREDDGSWDSYTRSSEDGDNHDRSNGNGATNDRMSYEERQWHERGRRFDTGNERDRGGYPRGYDSSDRGGGYMPPRRENRGNYQLQQGWLKDRRQPHLNRKRQATCFVCEEEGHYARDCPWSQEFRRRKVQQERDAEAESGTAQATPVQQDEASNAPVAVKLEVTE